jgi:hypothetical protein
MSTKDVVVSSCNIFSMFLLFGFMSFYTGKRISKDYFAVFGALEIHSFGWFVAYLMKFSCSLENLHRFYTFSPFSFHTGIYV